MAAALTAVLESADMRRNGQQLPRCCASKRSRGDVAVEWQEMPRCGVLTLTAAEQR